ncbi:methylase MraW [Thecamonas trahens ATCC 50062]|uniref:Methylase MraW n=1 Tax=Thecamonas trahens ATCC 50062 TaxID=461836 RepID=A0A0L0DHM9_THETB|nr:methylase MraW [Thecamonas trahens ATCC 50062]KNC51879.1 methylase MraW [Thecamonas trahens ATCC 50062]|eukprot:XP_013755737.1 methylase MraW [Thecamonas trahens ATCC 50062]
MTSTVPTARQSGIASATAAALAGASERGHEPVLVEPVLQAVVDAVARVGPRSMVVDATFGCGGYTRGLLAATGEETKVLGIDRDASMEIHAAPLAERHPERLAFACAPFSTITSLELSAPVAAVVFDLGLNSAALDDPARGFSFRPTHDGPLDMRMSPQAGGETAADLVARMPELELSALFTDLGGERPRLAARIAQALVAAREAGAAPTTTQELASLVARIKGSKARRKRDHHPATLVFQALRMAVNHEMDELRAGLAGARDVLADGGALVVVSYHSGEDGVVKRFLRSSRSATPPHKHSFGGPTPGAKSITAPRAEAATNPRARSARLRVGIRDRSN